MMVRIVLGERLAVASESHSNFLPHSQHLPRRQLSSVLDFLGRFDYVLGPRDH